MGILDCSDETQQWMMKECIDPIVNSASEKIGLHDIIADCKVPASPFQRIDLAAVVYQMLSCWAESPNAPFSSIVSKVTRAVGVWPNPVWFVDCAIAIRDKCTKEIAALEYVRKSADDSIVRSDFRAKVMGMIDYIPFVRVSEKCRQSIVDSAFDKIAAQGVPGARDGREPIESEKRKFKPATASALDYFASGKDDEQKLCKRLNQWREVVPFWVSDIVGRVQKLCCIEIEAWKMAVYTRHDLTAVGSAANGEHVRELEERIEKMLRAVRR